ncbi:hypothetical protein CHUAL_006214 [Chamberlinius hualienensis]
MLKFVVSFIILTAIYPAESIIDLNIDVNLKIDGVDLINDINGKCLYYSTVAPPPELSTVEWYTVSSNTSTRCTKVETGATNPVMSLINFSTDRVSFLNPNGSIVTQYSVSQKIAPGKYLVKDYPPNLNGSINTATILGTYVMSYLKFSNDTRLSALCPIKGTTAHEALSIYTTTGKETASVIDFAKYAETIGAASAADFKLLNLTSCQSFYP